MLHGAGIFTLHLPSGALQKWSSFVGKYTIHGANGYEKWRFDMMICTLTVEFLIFKMGISESELTSPHMFQRGGSTTNLQHDITYIYIYIIIGKNLYNMNMVKPH